MSWSGVLNFRADSFDFKHVNFAFWIILSNIHHCADVDGDKGLDIHLGVVLDSDRELVLLFCFYKVSANLAFLKLCLLTAARTTNYQK